MERVNRKPFQGITNILKFNWHFYVLAGIGIAGLSLLYIIFHTILILVAIAGIATTIGVSLAISYYIYDYSHLYELNWLNHLTVNPGSHLININAGFDETSALLKHKYANSLLTVFDFYEPLKHTEISIKRARKAYPLYPGTIPIQTTQKSLTKSSANLIFLIFAAHEIRNTRERILFFTTLKNTLNNTGRIIIAEHLRDIPNLLVYNIGAFHFLQKKEWEATFANAGLEIESETKFSLFISIYTLKKNGDTS